MFVDGRYTLQAAKQVDGKVWSVEPLIDPPPESWLAKHLAAGDRLGFDPWLHTSAAAERLAAACAKAGAELVAVDSNPLDSVWTERPPPLWARRRPARNFSGEVEGGETPAHPAPKSPLGVDALVLSDSHAVAWTFNIRGADVAHTPLPLSYALVPKDGRPIVFIDHRKLSNSARDHLEHTADVREPDALTPELTGLAQRGCIESRSIARPAADALEPPDRCGRRQAGARQRSRPACSQGRPRIPPRSRHESGASARRGSAGAVPGLDRPRSGLGRATEIDAVEALETFRRDTGALKDISFPTIAGIGAERRDRALPRHPQEGNRGSRPAISCWSIPARKAMRDGTTDVTRTIARWASRHAW